MKRFVVPIYDTPVALVRTRAELERECNRIGLELPEKNTEGICIQADHDSGRSHFILGWFVPSVSVLAHEVVHLSQFILTRAGIDPRDSCGETQAYLVGWIIDKCVGKAKH